VTELNHKREMNILKRPSKIVVLNTIQAAAADLTFEDGVLDVTGLEGSIPFNRVLNCYKRDYVAGTANKKTITPPAAPVALKKYEINLSLPKVGRQISIFVFAAATGETQATLNDKILAALSGNPAVTSLFTIVEATSTTVTVEVKDVTNGPLTLLFPGGSVANTTPHVTPLGTPADITEIARGFSQTIAGAGTYHAWVFTMSEMVPNGGPQGPQGVKSSDIWIVANEAAANYGDFETALNGFVTGVAGAIGVADNFLGVPNN